MSHGLTLNNDMVKDHLQQEINTYTEGRQHNGQLVSCLYIYAGNVGKVPCDLSYIVATLIRGVQG